MPTIDEPLLEVACDESGSEGEHLIGGNTDVFAHGSVHVSVESAAASIEEIRRRVRSPATEYKANHLLRQKQRSVLEWFLGPAGPLVGRAHVHLTDKTYFVLLRVVEVLTGESETADGPARVLRGQGPHATGAAEWQGLLESANNLLRTRSSPVDASPVDAFFGLVEGLCSRTSDGPVLDILAQLSRGRMRAEAVRAQLRHDPAAVPVLEPLVPALVSTIVHWSASGRPVSLVHDETNTLTPARQSRLHQSVGDRLTDLRLVDSAADPRVQLADFLAGVSRKIASEALNRRGDPELTSLLRPYVARDSVWGDELSWAMLSG